MSGLALATVFGVTGCSAGPASGSIEVGAHTVVIDVRTADEYATGHLEGAQLLDISNGDLAAALPSLDPDAEYLLYCRSGNRSGQAVALMEQAGFTDLTNLGSVKEASKSTGIDIVK